MTHYQASKFGKDDDDYGDHAHEAAKARKLDEALDEYNRKVISGVGKSDEVDLTRAIGSLPILRQLDDLMTRYANRRVDELPQEYEDKMREPDHD